MLNLKEYHRPGGLPEAVALLRRSDVRTVVLGGGTWLMGEAPHDVEAVVDVADLGLNKIVVDANMLRIGAAVVHQTLVEHELMGAAAGRQSPLRVIGQAAAAMSGRSIRNRATIAGAVVTADSASPLVTALLACDADVVVAGARDERRDVQGPPDFWRVIPLSGFLAYRRQVLDEGSLITEVRLPIPSTATRSSYERVARTPKDYPIVCAVASLTMKDGVAGNVRVAVGGVAAAPIRLSQFELGVERRRLDAFLDRELDAAMHDIQPPGDWLGSADYRKEMARVLVRRVVNNCRPD
jgi:CO/xanthine dehydrogenase FAD-binding subunit